MSRRLQRVRRRAGDTVATHDRARGLAATRLDQPLTPTEATWLDEHLAWCGACRGVAASYESDRLALRAMRDRTPEPPRDLWARTSAAIEREAARGGRSRRRGATGRPRPALGVLSGVAVIAVVIGASVMSGGWLNTPTTTFARGVVACGGSRERECPTRTDADRRRGRLGRLGRCVGGRPAGLQRDAGQGGLSGRAQARLCRGRGWRGAARRPQDPAEVDLAVAGPQPGGRRRHR